MSVKVVKLKNGAEEAEAVVTVTMMSLRHMLESGLPDAFAFYDLVMVCRDSNYQMWPRHRQKLIDLALMEPNGNVHDSIRNIVLSAAEGELLDLHLTDPREHKA